mmetsp:Transcript_29295/g.49927  ORF Transcript_29295/g.49927 Transcript_29295/m.49927 type:complete len:332 (-) Transcript_29295:160-1155(-)
MKYTTKTLAAASAALLSCESAVAFSSTNLSSPRSRSIIGNGINNSGNIQQPQQQQTSTTLYLGDFFNFGKKEEQETTTTPPTPEEEAAQTGYVDDEDPIEKIFGIFFGKKEAEPMGMKRFGAERFPEQYPAVLDEWADPVEGDDKEMALLRPLLKNTNLETRNLRLTYDANRDGYDPVTFHSKVDKQGGAIVFCTTRAGIQCGGYNPKGWVGYGEARGSIAAFLYILGGKYAAAGAPAIKLRKVGGPGLAQMDLPESGPSFSPDALVIPLGKDGRLARSKLGSYYERLPDGTNSLFGKDSNVQLRDLKVYHGVYAEGEYIPFTDAEPFALY